MADPVYLDLLGFRARTVMPASDVDGLEVQVPGWILQQLADHSRKLDSKLRKRYAAPFASPYPSAVQTWLAQIVTPLCYLKRGVNPSDAQFDIMHRLAEDAWAEVREAADSNEGLFDLPLRAGSSASGISRGGTSGYSEQSPYVTADRQSDTGKTEDLSGEGTYV